MGLELVPEDIRNAFQVKEWKHAIAILAGDYPKEWADILEVLRKFRLLKSQVATAGGNITKISQYFNKAFRDRGWREKKFETAIEVDGVRKDSPTHLVDCFKNEIALEIEWNNKDPFFDRDLNNFRLLFELRAAHVGVIITKSNDLIPILKSLGIFGKYGMTTTWMSKLLPRIDGGGGGGCPLLVFAITPAKYEADVSDKELAVLVKQAQQEKAARKAKKTKGAPLPSDDADEDDDD